ncbi:hypothetical protein ABD87_22985 [Lysinibacillus sphaericus]|uniref:hypothetical protein n=1 Tax=Lysinibacillus sphaericus TaxID=1421 RepID=UPI0018CDB082|nr:hypothetical protein [Lysinibacillus sphaericus]MBG9732292.1 hypothetical protein [Lysinibacillus sphaericus]
MARSKIPDEDDLWMDHLLNEVDNRLNGNENETEKYEVENNVFYYKENTTKELENGDEIDQQSTRFTELIFTCFVIIIFLFACVILYIQLLNL